MFKKSPLFNFLICGVMFSISPTGIEPFLYKSVEASVVCFCAFTISFLLDKGFKLIEYSFPRYVIA